MPEFSLCYRLREVPVGRGDETDVDPDGFVATDPLKLLLLQNPQELDLHLGRHFANLIEKQGTAVGKFEATKTFLGRAGECAFFMAEEFAFDQPAWQGSTVYLDERSVRALLDACTARAINSLPVPVSPRMSTEESVPPTNRTFSSASWSALL